MKNQPLSRYPDTELQPYQYELSVLAEECGEIIQITGKVLRFGWDSYSPLDKQQTTNAELLHSEVGDMLAAVDFAVERGMLDREKLLTRQFEKRKRMHALAPDVIALQNGIAPEVRTEYEQPRTLHLVLIILLGLGLLAAAFYVGRTSTGAAITPEVIANIPAATDTPTPSR